MCGCGFVRTTQTQASTLMVIIITMWTWVYLCGREQTIVQIYESGPKIAFELFDHSFKNRNESVEWAEWGNGQVKQQYCINTRVIMCLQVQAVFSKCIRKGLAAHLATSSYSFSSHFKNHPVTAGLVKSQDLTAEANGNKFRLRCICGAQELMERYRPVANVSPSRFSAVGIHLAAYL